MLKGKVALITGASRGIGAAIALEFARAGAILHLCARSQGLESLAQQLAIETGAEVHAHIGDVCDDAFLRQTIVQIKKQHGHLNVLVNNAGVIQQGLLGMISMDQTRQTFDVNVMAMISWTQFALKILPSGSSIVNIASIAGTRGMEGVSAYAASKGAVLGFTRAIAKDLAAKQIRANAIAPGFIDTGMTQGVTADWYQKRIESIGMGRIGQPEDIAKVALFFASDLSTYVTGQVIGVDGGMIA